MNDNTIGIRRVDDILKIFLGVALSGIFALLAWLSLAVNETNIKMVEINGKQELTNAKLGFLQKEMSGLPRRDELVSTDSKIESLEARVIGLESWMSVLQRAPNKSKTMTN